MVRKCCECKYCNSVSEIELMEYKKDGYTGKRCMLSGKWVCENDLCSLSFDIARQGRWHFTKEDFLKTGGTDIGKYICSLCGYNTFMEKDFPMSFCPRCGANMGKDLGMKRINIETFRQKELWEDITGLELKKEWQSVSTRLPQYNESVLVVSEDGDIDRCFINKENDKWYKIGKDGGEDIYGKEPAYWLETDFPDITNKVKDEVKEAEIC